MNVTLTLGGLNTTASLAALAPGVSANSTATQAMNTTGSAAQSNADSSDSLTTQSNGDSAFSRYTSQYRRLTSIVMDSGGKYDRDQQMRAYMELRTMAASGKLKGMPADDQRLWMEVNSSSVSLLQKDNSTADSTEGSSQSSTSTASTSATSGTTETSASEEADTTTTLIGSDNDSSGSQTTSSVNDNDSGDTVDLSPTAQEIIQALQDKASDKLTPLEVLLSQQSDENSSSEVGTVISLTV